MHGGATTTATHWLTVVLTLTSVLHVQSRLASLREAEDATVRGIGAKTGLRIAVPTDATSDMLLVRTGTADITRESDVEPCSRLPVR